MTASSNDKRYQVFVSSTFKDLRHERQVVTQALLELDCIPSGMELFPAANEDQWSFIKKVIDDCDYYLVIVAGRYGSTDADGVGFTEKEYDYAVKIGKPVIAFVHSDPGSITSSNTESSEEGKNRLEAFRRKVRQKLCKDWRSADELATAVTTSYVRLIKSTPAEGWIRARNASDPQLLARLPALQQKVVELEAELAAIKSAPPERAKDLASGDETYAFSFTYEPYSADSLLQHRATPTWNELICMLGPVLFDDVSEDSLARYFAEQLVRFIPTTRGQIKFGPHLNDEDFQRVKMQLFALGIIEKGRRAKDSKGTRLTTWRLTPFGQAYLLERMAIRTGKRNG